MNVVEDENAYLGLNEDPENGKFLKIKNQFAGKLTLRVNAKIVEPDTGYESEVEVDYESGEVDIEIEPETGDETESETGDNTVTIGLGKRTYVTTSCEVDRELQLELSFFGTVENSETTVHKNRRFTVDCTYENDESTSSSPATQNKVSGVTFESGNSGVIVNTTDSASDNAEFTVTVYYKDNRDITSITKDGLSGDKTLQLKQTFGGTNNGNQIVGVQIAGISGVFDREAIDHPGKGDPGGTVTVADTVPLNQASFQD
ncbi:hypothetical protein EXE43_22385 [Halorubrum sp. SS5]|nr:hypothetical protein EXE43_22385 [Halorubrum sp. SS5]